MPGLLNLARTVSTKKGSGRPLEHPVCAMLWHVCQRGPHMFEIFLWSLWLLELAVWVTIFVLVVHCGATRTRPQHSRCIIDVYCPCWAAERRRRAAADRPRGLALHSRSVDDLTNEALKLTGLTEAELEEHQRRAQGSPKEALVQLILGRPPRRGGAAAAPDDEEMGAAGERQPLLSATAAEPAPDDY